MRAWDLGTGKTIRGGGAPMRGAAPLIAIVAALGLSGAAHAAVAPKTGEYVVNFSLIADTCPGAPNVPGLEGTGVAFWPGPAAAGFRIRLPTVNDKPVGQDGALVIATGPTTPAAGVTTWSGNLTALIYPGKQPAVLSFTAKVTYATNDAFLITFQSTQDCGDGTTGTRTETGVFALI